MSDSYDRSYYEIALTNGQVLVALGILLGCVVGAFLSGLWVAKKALDEGPMVVETRSADDPDAETFEFFGQGQGQGQDASGIASEAAAIGADSTGSTDNAEPRSDSALASRQTARAQPTEAAAEPPRVAVSDPPRRVEESEATRRASSSAQPTRRPGPEPDRSPAASGTDIGKVIQVFSSNDRTQADQLVRRLSEAGYQAFVSPVEVDGRTMHRVRVGPFERQDQAEKQAAEIKRTFKLDTWITAG